MELIRGLHNLRPRHRGCVATIGAFDGVHHGHQQVLKQLISKGRELGLPTAVIVFEPLPREYFAPEKAPARLMSFREKFVALRDLGIDRILRIRFTPGFRQTGAEDFIKTIFVEGLDTKYIIVGDDLRFGRDQGGDVNLLREAGKSYGFEVQDTSTIMMGSERVSSTRIRQALQQDDLSGAAKLLGRPYSISGRIISGQQLGRQIGVPTANIQLRRIKAPLSGVYTVAVKGLGEAVYKGVANVGSRPTVNELPEAILEVHLFDFNEMIYGKKITVEFLDKIRDEKKFDSVDSLKDQIFKDIESAKQFFNTFEAE